MESVSMGKEPDGAAYDQPDQGHEWHDTTRHRTNTRQQNNMRRRRIRRGPRRNVFRKLSPRYRNEDSTPTMVADFVFRKQIEWLVENTGVRDDFKDVAQKIWFSYLSHYMPNLEDGIKKELSGNKYWHLAYPRADLPALLHCSRRELGGTLEDLRKGRVARNENADVKKTPRLWKDYGQIQRRSVSDYLKYFRPTPVLLTAIIGLALHICQEEVMMSDLLRWTRLLKLPLVDLTRYKDMASSSELRGIAEKSQRTMYGTHKYSMVERINVWMAGTLLNGHVGKIPALPVAPFVERFIEELNLPTDMIPFVMSLLERMNSTEYRIESISIHRPPNSIYKRSLNMEAHLMCVIFYALRILFVLDDAAEKQISQSTERMQEMIPNVQLFNFGVWYQHVMHRRVLLFKHTMLSRRIHSAGAYCDFIQSNQIPRFMTRSERKVQDCELYSELQSSWRKSDTVYTSEYSCSFLIDLPVTVRPYRAHTEALSEHYPELAVDFSHHTIKHLLTSDSWAKDIRELQPGLQTELSAIQDARKSGYMYAQPFRLVRNRGNDRKHVIEKENRARITQDLVWTMAEMIEQQPAQLFGYLLYLEIVFFPNHPHCSHTGNSRNLKKLRV